MKKERKRPFIVLFAMLLVFSCILACTLPDDPGTEITVESVTISNGSVSLTIDGTVQLNAVVLPADAANLNVSWSSSDTSIATVSASGVVTALAEGTVTITVTTAEGGFTASCVITITIADDPGIPFISVWDMSLSGRDNDYSLNLPFVNYGTYDFTVDWGDGTIEHYSDINVSHDYDAPSIYVITITGNYYGFGYKDFTSNLEERKCLIDIKQWGNISLHEDGYNFSYCTNLRGFSAKDAPDLSPLTNLRFMFRECEKLNADFSEWDMSNITNMAGMFYGADSFNGNISNWDVSSVTDMNYMFCGTDSFNQDLSAWEVSSVSNMSRMFWNAEVFNQDLSAWDVSAVKYMIGMFSSADSFDQDLSEWDVSSVESMAYMFQMADNYTNGGNASGLEKWDTGNVTAMYNMFDFCQLTSLPSWYTP